MKPIFVLFPLALLVSLAGCGQPSSSSSADEGAVKYMDSKTSYTELQKGAVALDIRTPQEYTGGHLAEALHIDWYGSEFASKVEKLDRDQTYVVYCATSNRSRKAVERMAQMGFQNLILMTDGFQGWRSKGLPVTTD